MNTGATKDLIKYARRLKKGKEDISVVGVNNTGQGTEE